MRYVTQQIPREWLLSGDFLNHDLGGCALTQEGNDFYITGADAVRKKLGSGKIFLSTIKFSGQGNVNNALTIDIDGQSTLLIDSVNVHSTGDYKSNTLYIYKDNSIIANYKYGITKNISIDINGASQLKINIDGWANNRYIAATISGLTIE